MPHRTPCTECAHDRARIFVTHRIPCIDSADDRARIFDPPPHSLHSWRRRPCSQIDAPPHSLHIERTTTVLADSRPTALLAPSSLTTVLAYSLPTALLAPSAPDDRADKHRTPCTSSDTSPRARMAPLSEGLSSASRPSPRKASFRLPHLSHRRQRQAPP